MNPEDPAEFCEQVSGRLVAALPIAPRFGPRGLPCLEPDVFEIELTAPLGDRSILPAPSPITVRLSPYIARLPFDTGFTVIYDPAGLGDETTIGDDVMVRSVDDPSVQIQVTGVFGEDPSAGVPGPIVQDRWVATGTARLIVPAGTPPGDYTFMFIEHPQLNGVLTVG